MNGAALRSGMVCRIEAVLTPAEFPALRERDLSSTVCVVFDVLRATSAFVTALANGAAGIRPVADLPEALALRRAQPEVLLAGEREGWRIGASLTGGVEFDLGNSPREFSADRVVSRTIVSTTTNGTRAWRACARARRTLAGSFLNLSATAEAIAGLDIKRLVVVCAGTGEGTALEDVLAAGALCEMLGTRPSRVDLDDAAEIARGLFRQAQPDWRELARRGRNARRLLAQPELRDDVEFCLQLDQFNLIAEGDAGGMIRGQLPGSNGGGATRGAVQ